VLCCVGDGGWPLGGIIGPLQLPLRAFLTPVRDPLLDPGPMDHLESQIGAVDVRQSADILDRIDEIVPPGVTKSRTDSGVPATRLIGLETAAHVTGVAHIYGSSSVSSRNSQRRTRPDRFSVTPLPSRRR
jgi:hypothetical protein